MQPRALVRTLGAELGPAVLCGAVVAVPLAYAPFLEAPFVEPKLALLLVAGALGLGGWALATATGAARPNARAPLAIAFAAVLATTVISALVAARRGSPGAPYAGAELLRWLAIAGVAAAASQSAADPRWRGRLLEGIHAAAGVVALLGLMQHLQLGLLPIPIISLPGSTFGNRNIGAEAVALALPFGLALVTRQGERSPALVTRQGERSPAFTLFLALLFLALEVVYLAVARARGAWLGGVLGLATFMMLRRPVRTRAVTAALLALGVAAVLAAVLPGPWALRHARDAKRYEPGGRLLREALDPTSPVARTRLGLWRRTLAMYREHPLMGVGPGNFAVEFPRYAEPGASEDGVLTPAVAPRRAHDDLVERLAETGPLGLLALLALYAAAAREGHRRARGVPTAVANAGGDDGSLEDRALAAAGAGAIAALVGCGLTGFPLAMPGTALLFGVGLGVLAPRVRPAAAATTPLALALAFTVAAVGFAGVVSARRVAGSYWLLAGQRALGARDTEAARAALARATADDPRNFDASVFAALAAQRADDIVGANRAVTHALALEPFSPNAWAMRASVRLSGHDLAGAEAAARQAVTLLADYPDALSLLARAAAGAGDEAQASGARARLAALAAAGNVDARKLLPARFAP